MTFDTRYFRMVTTSDPRFSHKNEAYKVQRVSCDSARFFEGLVT